MPSLTIQYVYFGVSGAHTRQPRGIGSYGGFTPIPSLNPWPPQTVSSGSPCGAGPADPSLDIDSLMLTFAFMNVSGLVEGPRTSFVANMPPPPGHVGTDPIVILYVYVPQGSNGGHSGAVIDAFNASTNALVDNNFVTVTPDPSGTLTTEANVQGWVDTQTSAPTIVADHPNIGSYLSSPTDALFDQWVDLANATPPASLISGANLTPGQGSSVYALAFYHNPAPKSKDYIEHLPSGYVLKQVSEIPKLKDSEQSGQGNVGDPEAIRAELGNLNDRVAQLESVSQSKGSAFIKTEDRPQVAGQ
jgi:hypothetical protein